MKKPAPTLGACLALLLLAGCAVPPPQPAPTADAAQPQPTLAAPAPLESPAPIVVAEADLFVPADRYLATLAEQREFNGAVLIARGGRVVLSKGYGLANRDQNLANGPNTRFRIEVVTEPFTAAAILLLQERGRLSVEDSICDYIAGCPESWQPITIHQLLTHTSGIADYTAQPIFFQQVTQPATPQELLERVQALPLASAPGQRFSLSQSNYMVLGWIIQQASGQSYTSFMRGQIFEPLGMYDTGHDRSGVLLPNRAVGYRQGTNGLEPAPEVDMSNYFGAADMYSTIEDMYRWNQALRAGQLLSRASLLAMFTPYAVLDRSTGLAFGYGWVIDNRYNRPMTWAAGESEGYLSFLAHFTSDDTTIITLTNNRSIEADVPGELARLLFEP